MEFKVFKFDNGEYLTDINRDNGGLWFSTSEDVLNALHIVSERDLNNTFNDGYDAHMADVLTYLTGKLVIVEVTVGK